MIKMIKERSVYLRRNADGKEVYRAELITDTAEELAGVTEVGGNVLDFGSIAHAVDDAQILRLDSSSDWIIQTGDDAGKTPAEVASSKTALSAPKMALTKAIEDEDDNTGEPLPEVKESADTEPLESVEKSVETVDTETEKAVDADDKPE